jgi:hypothetical protein
MALMKKWLLGIGVLFLLAAAALLGVGLYQNYVVGKIKEVLLQTSAEWQGAAGGVKYSFWNDEITLVDFSFSFNTPAGAYSAAIGQALVQGVHADALQSDSDNEALADKVVLDGLDITCPNGAAYHIQRALIGKIRGPFGQLRRQMRGGARKDLAQSLGRVTLSDVICEDISAQGLTCKFDALSVDKFSADKAALLSGENINMSAVRLIANGQRQADIEHIVVSYDLFALAPGYTLGEEAALLRRVLAFRDPLKVDLELKNVNVVFESAVGGAAVPLVIDHYKCGIVNQAGQFVADMQLGNMAFALPETGRDIKLNFNLSSKIARDGFYPTRLKLVIDDMASFDSEILLQGFTLSEAKLQKLFFRYVDGGALNYILQRRAANLGETIAQARSNLIADIEREFADRNLLKNDFLSDFLTSLEQFINNPGVLEISVAPPSPLSARQAALTFLIQPRALNYAISVSGE